MLIILKKSALPWLVLVAVLLFIGEARGQTPVPTYLTGHITGNKFEAGSFIGAGTGNAGLTSPMLTHAWGCLLGVQTNEFRFYYNTAANFSAGAPTTVTAARSLGLLGVLGAGGDAYIQFRNTGNATIAAGTPTYFRLNTKPTAGGISLNLGGVLGLTELQSIKGVAYSGAGNYSLNTSTLGFLSCPNPYNGNENSGTIVGTSTTKLLIDAFGSWFAKVTPSLAYNSVRLNVAYPEDKLLLLDLAALANLNASINVNVHSAFTQPDGGVCNLSPQFVSPGEIVSGITLSPAQVTAGIGINLNQLVTNPERSINGNANDYTSFSSGLASVGAVSSVAQSYYFDHSSTVDDGIRLQLGVQQSLIDLGVLGRTSLKFKAYKGETEVYSTNLASLATLLQLNLLNLVTINGSTHKRLDLTFKPGVAFDRFEITFDQGLAAVGVLGDALRIYEVSMAPSLPTITLQPTNPNPSGICEGDGTSFVVGATASAGGVVSGYQWEYFNTVDSTWTNAGSAIDTLSLSNVTNAMNNRWFRAKVTGGNPGCPYDIYSNEVQLIVKPKALATDIDAPGITICQGLSTNLTASCNLVTIPNPTFKWYANADLTGLLATGSSYSVTPTTTTSYWVTVEGTATCQNAPNSAKQVTVVVTPHPPPPITITSN
ncbi:immunoglobulin domain-containing protein [Pedobacter insulae]|uniref:Ig-like domain-containing protein n=1 Tax=Pedobacter insulae TaxID=414048 RepID=A0A1I2ZBW2_9SPHI|nr:hypothetical protein [Pedobacter insulae]SFH35016.1 hypothetical protein SAMN04489864_109123 [Pedobacter insulae]